MCATTRPAPPRPDAQQLPQARPAVDDIAALRARTMTVLQAAADDQDAAVADTLHAALAAGPTAAAASAVAAGLLRQGHAELARDWLSMAFGLEPDCLSALLLRASCEMLQGEPSRAIATYGHIIDRHPSDIEACIELGTLLTNARDWEGALRATQLGLARRPGTAALCARRIDLLLRLERDDDALQFLRTLPPAVCADPAMAHARVSLLNRSGQFDAARQVLDASVADTVALRTFDLRLINQWLTSCLSGAQGLAHFPAQVARFSAHLSDDRRYQGLLAAYAMIGAWLHADRAEVVRIAELHADFADMADIDEDRAMRVFYRYLRQLAAACPATAADASPPLALLHVIGESHSLSPGNTVFAWQGRQVQARSRFIMGIQMHHLAQAGQNTYKQHVQSHLDAIGEGALLLTMGEIDCRPVEGMWRAAQRGHGPLDALIGSTVAGYLAFLDQALRQRPWPSITLQGVPAPGYDLTDRRDPGDKRGFLDMIDSVNTLLKAGARERHWHFLDVHGATAGQDRLGNGRWHLDRFHLAPAFYQQAGHWLLQAPRPAGGDGAPT